MTALKGLDCPGEGIEWCGQAGRVEASPQLSLKVVGG